MEGSHPKGPSLKEAGCPRSAPKCTLQCYHGLEDDRSVHKARPAWEAARVGGFAEGSSGWKILMEREVMSSSKQNVGPRPTVLHLQ